MTEEGAKNCKVVLVGESGVGKTSIITRYISNSFKSQQLPTTGANFVSKTVILEDENQSIKFELWDTAGQERYRSLARVFYKNAAVCVLVYDITRKSSFEELKKFWVKEIKENAPENIGKLLYIIIIILYLKFLPLLVIKVIYMNIQKYKLVKD
jgi:small GTP-binding protein